METIRKDGDEKTRANAVGALGNLARNGSQLCSALCAAGCPQLLLKVALSDVSIHPKRIALFSIGTIISNSLCRDSLLDSQPSVLDLIKTYKNKLDSLSSPHFSDETSLKYVSRVRQKLKQTPTS